MGAFALADNLDLTIKFDLIADALVDSGYCLIDDFFPPELISQLAIQVRQLPADYFKRAAIGRATDQQINQFVRTDEIHWLNGQNGFEQQYLKIMSELRTELNRRLFMGLFDYECHFAHYSQGAYYKRHLDAFKGNTNRVLSTVLYLNPDWDPADGGELLMYRKKVKIPFVTVTPKLGSFILFLSERFPHEVLAARKDRYSLTGWFRVNNSLGDSIDPSR
ncbi:2OG-Fe(II) oxygenase [Neptunicella sp. SCSIO 80796]|uniref:2OG-Fe(II) oxygenase n=1 Tax=Neptunicella plasticusilytica TaxID=3117012 RepID=UPI003A4E34CB